MGLTLVVVAFFARDWDQHSTFEEREMVRARKRKAKWERNKDKRARDRARWEAHQARRAGKQVGGESGRHAGGAPLPAATSVPHPLLRGPGARAGGGGRR